MFMDTPFDEGNDLVPNTLSKGGRKCWMSLGLEEVLPHLMRDEEPKRQCSGTHRTSYDAAENFWGRILEDAIDKSAAATRHLAILAVRAKFPMEGEDFRYRAA